MRDHWRRGGCSTGNKDRWRGTGGGTGGRKGGRKGAAKDRRRGWSRKKLRGIERVVMIVFVVVGSKLEEGFFILSLATWETTERGKRARTFFVGKRWCRGTDSTLVSRRSRRSRRSRHRRCHRVIWGLWWWVISRVRRGEIGHEFVGVERASASVG
jgi:hypothetical protein